MAWRLAVLISTLAVVLSALPWLAAAQNAAAGHAWPQSDAKHIANLHYWSNGHGFYDEDACYDSDSASITDATFKGYLEDALWNASGWDLTGNGNLDIWTTTYDCANYDLSVIELKYLVRDEGACGGFSCQTSWDYPVIVNGVTKHYNLSEVIFKTSHMQASAANRRGTISHETGHMFSLKDPANPIRNGQGTVTTSYCEDGGWWFGSSVMHQYEYYGCPSGDISFPTVYDKETVVNGIIPSH